MKKLGKMKIVGFLLLLANLTYIYADVEQASSNEFPATVSTAPSEHEGFVLEWEDGNLSDFVRQLSDATTNFQLDSVDLFGIFNSESDSTSHVAAHSYHRTDVSHEAVKTKETVETAKAEEVTEDDKDWRSERKWWQRGSPVL